MTTTRYKKPEITDEQRLRAQEAEELALLCQLYSFRMRDPERAKEEGVSYGIKQEPVVTRLVDKGLVDRIGGETNRRITSNSLGNSYVGPHLIAYEFRARNLRRKKK